MKKRINHQDRIATALERIADSVEMQNAIPRSRFGTGGYVAGPKPNIQTPAKTGLKMKINEETPQAPAIEPMTEFD